MSHKIGQWIEDGDQQDRWPAFTCPECGHHHYHTSRKGSADGGYSTVHCSVTTGCGWVGNYHDYLVPNMEGSSATTAPKELFVQLGLNGAACASCQDGRPWCDILVASEKDPEDFLCIMWARRNADG